MATGIIGLPTDETAQNLQPGDRLTRDEFERRYEFMPQVKKAELVEGVVHMPSPVSVKQHGAPHADFIGWLTVYKSHTPGVEVADNTTLRLDWDNELQPDAMLRILAECGGQTRDEQGYVALAPEWLGEITSTTASYDLHDKKEAYRRNGVLEYVVWRVLDRAIDWFVLRGGRYDSLSASADGILRSEVLPGLWLDSAALLDDNMRRVLDVLQQSLDSREHAAFVDRLNHARKAT
jgi:Uma2 family endonuclease